MAKTRTSYVCQNCGAITQRWQGKCNSCGEWNTIIEEAAALGLGGASPRRGGSVGRPFPLEDLSGEFQAPGADRHRHRRARPRRRRRIRAGLGDADRRRTWHWQVDAADPGLRRAGAPGPARRLRLGRGIAGAGAVARRPPGALHGASATRRANPGRGHRRNAGLRRCATIRRHRFDPDDVERCDRSLRLAR